MSCQLNGNLGLFGDQLEEPALEYFNKPRLPLLVVCNLPCQVHPPGESQVRGNLEGGFETLLMAFIRVL